MQPSPRCAAIGDRRSAPVIGVPKTGPRRPPRPAAAPGTAEDVRPRVLRRSMHSDDARAGHGEVGFCSGAWRDARTALPAALFLPVRLPACSAPRRRQPSPQGQPHVFVGPAHPRIPLSTHVPVPQPARRPARRRRAQRYSRSRTSFNPASTLPARPAPLGETRVCSTTPAPAASRDGRDRRRTNLQYPQPPPRPAASRPGGGGGSWGQPSRGRSPACSAITTTLRRHAATTPPVRRTDGRGACDPRSRPPALRPRTPSHVQIAPQLVPGRGGRNLLLTSTPHRCRTDSWRDRRLAGLSAAVVRQPAVILQPAAGLQPVAQPRRQWRLEHAARQQKGEAVAGVEPQDEGRNERSGKEPNRRRRRAEGTEAFALVRSAGGAEHTHLRFIGRVRPAGSWRQLSCRVECAAGCSAVCATAVGSLGSKFRGRRQLARAGGAFFFFFFFCLVFRGFRFFFSFFDGVDSLFSFSTMPDFIFFFSTRGGGGG